jgi:hypothetical protein
VSLGFGEAAIVAALAIIPYAVAEAAKRVRRDRSRWDCESAA